MLSLVKFFIYILLSTLIFFLPNNPCLLLLIILDIFLAIICHSNFRRIMHGIFLFLPFIILTFIFNILLDNFLNASWVAVKLVIVCGLTMIYSGTISVLSFANLMERLFTPLKVIGINPADIKLLVCVALSLIPTLKKQLIEIRLASSAKFMPLNLRNLKATIFRFVSQTLSRINEIEASLLAKGYEE